MVVRISGARSSAFGAALAAARRRGRGAVAHEAAKAATEAAPAAAAGTPRPLNRLQVQEQQQQQQQTTPSDAGVVNNNICDSLLLGGEDFGLDLSRSADRLHHQVLSDVLEEGIPSTPPCEGLLPPLYQYATQQQHAQQQQQQQQQAAILLDPSHAFNRDASAATSTAATATATAAIGALAASSDAFPAAIGDAGQYPMGLFTIPSDRIVQTSRGLAVLLTAPPPPAPPNSEQNYRDDADAHQATGAAVGNTKKKKKKTKCAATSTTTAKAGGTGSRFRRWTPEEDELLRTAIALEGGPPHNWTTIAKKYFWGNRNRLQCKGRWTKVRT